MLPYLRSITCFRNILINNFNYKLNRNLTNVNTEAKENKDGTQSQPKSESEKVTFAKLFRESKFVSLGNLSDKVVVGRIIQVIGEDVYIDYGGKFNCICKKSPNDKTKYMRNDVVKILLKDFEMASHFLGAVKHITLLESDGKLLGLLRKKVRTDGDVSKKQEQNDDQANENINTEKI